MGQTENVERIRNGRIKIKETDDVATVIVIILIDTEIYCKNRQGTRCAYFKHRRNVFNGLKCIWMALTHDT